MYLANSNNNKTGHKTGKYSHNIYSYNFIVSLSPEMKPLAVCQRLDLHKNCQKYESVPLCISFLKLNRGRNSLENELLHSIIPVRHLFSLLTSQRLSCSKVPLGDFFAQVNNCQGGQFVHFCTCVFLLKSTATR